MNSFQSIKYLIQIQGIRYYRFGFRPSFNTFFGTAPLQGWHLLLSVPFAILIVLGDEVRRIYVRRGTPFVLRWLTW